MRSDLKKPNQIQNSKSDPKSDSSQSQIPKSDPSKKILKQENDQSNPLFAKKRFAGGKAKVTPKK